MKKFNKTKKDIPDIKKKVENIQNIDDNNQNLQSEIINLTNVINKKKNKNQLQNHQKDNNIIQIKNDNLINNNINKNEKNYPGITIEVCKNPNVIIKEINQNKSNNENEIIVKQEKLIGKSDNNVIKPSGMINLDIIQPEILSSSSFETIHLKKNKIKSCNKKNQQYLNFEETETTEVSNKLSKAIKTAEMKNIKQQISNNKKKEEVETLNVVSKLGNQWKYFRKNNKCNKKWTTHEIEALEKGVKKYGKLWKTILKKNKTEFDKTRRPIDLKLKYNLEHKKSSYYKTNVKKWLLITIQTNNIHLDKMPIIKEKFPYDAAKKFAKELNYNVNHNTIIFTIAEQGFLQNKHTYIASWFIIDNKKKMLLKKIKSNE